MKKMRTGIRQADSLHEWGGGGEKIPTHENVNDTISKEGASLGEKEPFCYQGRETQT